MFSLFVDMKTIVIPRNAIIQIDRHDTVTVQYETETIAAESLPRPFRLIKAGPFARINY
jgi:hypothetical protein